MLDLGYSPEDIQDELEDLREDIVDDKTKIEFFQSHLYLLEEGIISINNEEGSWTLVGSTLTLSPLGSATEKIFEVINLSAREFEAVRNVTIEKEW